MWTLTVEIGLHRATADLTEAGDCSKARLSEAHGTQTIAAGPGIRTIARLRKRHGRGRWRKLKGLATVRLATGVVRRAEVHWYEAHGIGRRNMKSSAS